MSTDVKTPEASETAEATHANAYAYSPRVDIHEDEHAYYLEAELPGVDEKSVDLKLEEGTLTIIGRVAPVQLDGYKQAYAEYDSGNFERAFRVSRDIDVERIEAKMAHGVLALTLPKREAVKPRRIDVKVA